MRPIRKVSSVHRHATTLAERADRYDLYQKSVQDVAWEMEFVEQVFREQRGRAPLQLREDFCGTALAACEWVRRDRRHQAIGVDRCRSAGLGAGTRPGETCTFGGKAPDAAGS